MAEGGADYDREDDEEYVEYEDGGDLPADFKPTIILFVLDVIGIMFTSKINGKSIFRTCLESLSNVANALLLRRGRRHRFCICQICSDSVDPVVIGFKKPIIDTIKHLEQLLNLSDLELQKRFQRSGDFCLMNVLNSCVKELSTYPEAKKFLVLLTNDDNPHSGDALKDSRALNIATVLKDKVDYCHVLPLKPGFEFAHIYKELLVIFNRTDINTFTAPGYIDDEELLNERVLSYFMSVLWPSKSKLVVKDFVVPVKEFRYIKSVQSVRFPVNARVLRQTNEKVKKESVKNYTNVDLENLEKKTVYENPNDHFKMTFTESEMEYLYPKYERRLDVIYTCESNFDLRFVVNNPFLVTAMEPKDYFYGLWLSCHKRNMVILCNYTSGYAKCHKKLVCLSPVADGFLASYVPYQDEIIGQFPDVKNRPSSANVSEEKLEAAGKLVNSLTRPFELSNYPNTEIELENEHLKALFLERPIKEGENSGVEPRVEPNENVTEAVTEFLSVMHLDEVTTTKRQGESSKPGVKKAKLQLTDETVRRMIDEDTLGGLTVDELKSFLRTKTRVGLTGKKKDVLISMVKDLCK